MHKCGQRLQNSSVFLGVFGILHFLPWLVFIFPHIFSLDEMLLDKSYIGRGRLPVSRYTTMSKLSDYYVVMFLQFKCFLMRHQTQSKVFVCVFSPLTQHGAQSSAPPLLPVIQLLGGFPKRLCCLKKVVHQFSCTVCPAGKSSQYWLIYQRSKTYFSFKADVKEMFATRVHVS